MPARPRLLLAVLLIVTLAVLKAAPQAQAKRFDCRLFCKETGFHGMLGGCRCSFTLFTAKRALREAHEMTNMERIMTRLLPGYRYQQPHQMIHNSPENEMLPSLSVEDHTPFKIPGYPMPLPTERGVTRLTKEESDGEQGHFASERTGNFGDKNQLKKVDSYTENARDNNRKRREFEMDLDNGDTADFYRMPY